LKRALVLLALVVACQANPAPPSAQPAQPAPPASGYSPEPAATRGGNLVLADWETPETLDPIHATTLNDLRIASLLFVPLWSLGPDLKPHPDLLREVPTVANGDIKVGADGVSMTADLKLRPGLRWSDGVPLNADDLIFTVEAICSTSFPARDTSGFDRITRQDRKSDTEVIWHFGPRPRGACGLSADLGSGLYPEIEALGPRARLLPAHRLAPVPATAWAADPFFQHPDVVSGPFTFRDAVAGRLIDLAANPRYAAGRSRPAWLDGISYRFYNGKAALIAGLQAGEADVGFHLLPGDSTELRGTPRSSLVTTASLQGELLSPNHGTNSATGLAPPWVGDPPVLRALADATDRKALDATAFGGSATITPGLFPALLDPGATNSPGRALDAARQALEGDGWKAGADGIRSKASRRLAFTLLTVCDSEPRQVEQTELVRQWAEAGFAVGTACQPRTTFFGSFAKAGTNAVGAFDMSLYSNTWQPDPAAWAPFASAAEIPSAANQGGRNWGRCQDNRLEQQLAAGAAILDPVKRRSAYRDAAAEWLQYGCTIPLFEWPSVVERTTRLHNFAPNPTLVTDTWNASDWWLSAA
jgi:peptide/nickel transport system substrate-binding protein